jgi:hypothetical protein
VKIADMVPYERNARDHEKSMPELMASIDQFGLRGVITLQSPENPVIVRGHGRVEACRRLGWSEIPDGQIEYVGDLTDDEVRAFRIADNKSAEKSTYNKAMLREEVRGIKSLDMSRFGCDFKSRALPYGAERLKTDRAYNLEMVNRSDCGRDGFPSIKGRMAKPAELQGFNYAKSTPADAKADVGCHFFIDDYQFERLWQRPDAYLDVLKPYKCVLTPDFSLYMDMPDAMQQWNRYRSAALGNYWQRNGITVVPTLSWAQPSSYGFCFKGLPRHSTVATSTVGVARDEAARAVWRDGMREAMRRLEPRRVLLYGKDIGFDFGGCEVVEYKAGGFHGR